MVERTTEAYEAAFEKERAHEYPVIDAFEERMGFAVDRQRLEAAARVLACPVKKNPPNWQHGRVIYALARSYLAGGGHTAWLDIGTAKGFSAVCMAWAMADAGVKGPIQSRDIIDPLSREPRNSVEDGKTIHEFVDPFHPDGIMIMFDKVDDLPVIGDRIGFAFIDGSHTYDGVRSDINTVTPRQRAGDIILFDDWQVEPVRRAIESALLLDVCMSSYSLEVIDLLPKRKYAIAVKQ
jgi:Methyltransferase domain